MSSSVPSALPILDLSLADDPAKRPALLQQLHDALFNIGFLYIKNHGVPEPTVSHLTEKLPALFDLPTEVKAGLTKLNSPHFLGYSGFAEEVTLGKKDLREQFDYATELPVVYKEPGSASNGTTNGATNGAASGASRDFSQLYWRLRGPNQWPPEELLPGFKKAFLEYHDEIQALSYRFVHLIEEAFGIPIGTCDQFFQAPAARAPAGVEKQSGAGTATYLPPQHRIKLLKYPPSPADPAGGQGVGAHKDSSGWLTFLLQVGNEAGLEVLAADGKTWIPATPVDGTFVVNFGNAFEAATEGAVRATTHRVQAPSPTSPPRYSIPFFQALPPDMTVSEMRSYIPGSVRRLRRDHDSAAHISSNPNSVSSFLDPRWDTIGESQLRKWIRSHEDVGRKWYGDKVVDYYLS